MEGDVLNCGGEFVSPDREAEYRSGRLADTIRYVQLIFLFAFLLNTLFYLSDWRFFGQSHFWVAVPARTVIVAMSLACLLPARRATSFDQLQKICLIWSWPVILASAVLVSAHSEAALLIIFVLPVIFYLVLPICFRWAVAVGLCCSLVTLGGYTAFGGHAGNGLGLLLGMCTLNVLLGLVLSRSNRLRRLEWSAARAERAINRELTREREALQAILRAVPMPLLIAAEENGRFIDANPAARRYFGEGVLTGAGSLGSCLAAGEHARLMAGVRQDGKVSEFETRLLMLDGSTREVLLEATTAVVGGVESIVTVVVDITRRKEMEANLERLATTDPLTGLANRTRFFAHATAEIRRAQRYQHPLAVLMVDIDLFKRINDTLGHESGDIALVAFARLCQSLVRDHDLVARVGGEEFAVLLPETGLVAALALAERLRGGIERLEVPGLPIAMTVSIGVSEVRPGEPAVDNALSRADQALYSAKRAGRNRALPFLEADGSESVVAQ